MIEYQSIRIQSLKDYDGIIDALPDAFLRNPYKARWIEELKNRIGLACTDLLIEYPYYDSEYLSSYYRYYIKKFREPGKKSVRIHFFNHKIENTYIGYITVSPITHYLNLGKSHLHPQVLLDEKAFVMLSSFKANIYGRTYQIDSFPWMNQQKDFSVCAHVAAWAIMKFYGNEHVGYKDVNIGEIVDHIPEQSNRKLPTRGLNLHQMAEVFRKQGVSPIITKKEKGREQEFYRELLCYIESGIPVIGALNSREHAVAVIGHGDMDLSILEQKKGIIDSSECIASIIVNDDNELPYFMVPREHKAGEKGYAMEDIDFMIIPLYNRVHQEYAVLYERIKAYLNTGNLCMKPDSVIRIYMASANSLKCKAMTDDEMNEVLKDTILRLEMPKLIWCVEISGYEEYPKRLVMGRILIDSTASAGDNTPWILMHDCEKIRYYNGGEWFEIQERIEPYHMYQHNLKEVEVWRK